MFSVIFAWTNGWANHLDAIVLGRHHAHYDVTVMLCNDPSPVKSQAITQSNAVHLGQCIFQFDLNIYA